MTKISLSAAFSDLWSTEKKWTTVLLLGVCMLIPGVGPIVAIGYLFQRFARVRNGLPAEDFDFNNFVEFLKIGVWPFLVSLVISVISLPVVLIAYVPILAALAIDSNSAALAIGALCLTFLIYLVGIGVIMMFSFPAMLRSGLMSDFKAGFNWTFIKSFAGKVGIRLFGWMLLLWVITVPAMFVGYLAFFIGVYFVLAVFQFVAFHLLFQHYDLFLEQGGEKIEIVPSVLRNAPKTPPLPQMASPPALSEQQQPSTDSPPPPPPPASPES